MLVAQSCPALCDLVDCSLPGSSVHEIFQARILEWADAQSMEFKLKFHKHVGCGGGGIMYFSLKPRPRDFTAGPVNKNLSCNAGHLGSIPG